MREEVLRLQKLGRMPNESINDEESIDEVINQYDSLLESIKLPITYEEGQALVKLFPENAFYDMQWSLLKIIESLIIMVSKDDYIKLINSCPSEEWREALNSRYKNWINKRKANK